MIAAFLAGALVAWLIIALLVALLLGAVIAHAEKPAPELAQPEPSEFDIPHEWFA